MAGPFGWCSTGQHDACVREVDKWHFEGKKRVITGTDKCECTKRSCKCYVKRADRTKTRRRRKTMTVKTTKV